MSHPPPHCSKSYPQCHYCYNCCNNGTIEQAFCKRGKRFRSPAVRFASGINADLKLSSHGFGGGFRVDNFLSTPPPDAPHPPPTQRVGGRSIIFRLETKRKVIHTLWRTPLAKPRRVPYNEITAKGIRQRHPPGFLCFFV